MRVPFKFVLIFIGSIIVGVREGA